MAVETACPMPAAHSPLRLILPCLALALAGLACAIVNPTPISWALTSTPRPSPTGAAPAPDKPTPGDEIPAAPSLPTSIPTVIRTPERTRPAGSPTQTSRASSWLVYARSGESQLVIRYLEGGAEKMVDLPGPLLEGADLGRGTNPAGNLLAVRAGEELLLLDAASATLEAISPLLSAELQQAVQDGDQAAGLTARAAEDPRGLAWSPDGRFLAYIAAADGPSTDLYVYDTQSGRSKRLSRGSNQAASPFWTPDGKWIINLELRSTGDGFQPAAAWETSPTLDDTRRLYTPPSGSLGEVFLGWTASGSLLACSQNETGFYNLRELPLSARWVEPLYTQPFAAAAADPLDRLLVFIQDDRTGPPAGLPPGVYSLPMRTSQVEAIQEGVWQDVRWNASAKAFTISGSRNALVYRPGQATLEISGANDVEISPDGLWLAGLGTGGARLYQADGARLQEWLPGPVWQAEWLDDSSGLFLLGEAGLYLVRFPQALAVRVSPGVPAGAAAFVNKKAGT